MGIFGKVKNFLFETETQIIIKAELEAHREANKKLLERNEKLQSHNESMQSKMDKVLEEVDRNRSVMVGFGGDFHEILAKIREQLDSQDKVIHEGIGKLLETTEHNQAKLAKYYDEFVSHTEVLYKHDNDVKGKLQIIYDDFLKHFANLDERLESLAVTTGEGINKTKTMIQSSHDTIVDKMLTDHNNVNNHAAEIHDSIRSNSIDVIDKIEESAGTLGNIEEVITNPKPHSDIIELATSIQKGIEHINGFLNDEEYKQKWDMKQVTNQLIEVRQLLETLEAFIPEPPGDTQTKILEMFASTDFAYLSPKAIMDELGMTRKQVYSALARMCKNGSLVLLGRGQYALPSVGESIANDSSEE